MLDLNALAGQDGGTIALAFGAGCAAGYGFCARTVLKIANRRIDEIRADAKREQEDCDRRLTSMEMHVNRLQDMLFGTSPRGLMTPAFQVPPDMNDLVRRAGDAVERERKDGA